MSKRDYYEILDVGKDVDEKALKSAFRKKAMEFHPDRNPDNPDAEQKFKEINEAYEVLKDPQKRAAYDQMGHAAFQGGMGGAGGFDGFSGMNMNDIFDDLFSEVFGGGGRSRTRGGSTNARQRGSDLQYNMEITLEEAFTGKKADIEIPVSTSCDSCSGTGAAKGTSPVTCPTCEGIGRIRQAQGFFTVERTCPGCMGQGQTIKDPCKECHGSGVKQKLKTLSVNIPAGIEDGTRMRLAGEGEAGRRGGSNGDLYIFISVKPHLFFHRNGHEVLCRMPVSMTTAALGGHIEVPTVDGKKVKLAIKSGSQSGNRFRLRGKGMPVLRTSDFGDMIIEILVETPRNLSKKQKDLLEEFRKTQGEEDIGAVDEPGFFSKVRDFFDHLSDTK